QPLPVVQFGLGQEAAVRFRRVADVAGQDGQPAAPAVSVAAADRREFDPGRMGGVQQRPSRRDLDPFTDRLEIDATYLNRHEKSVKRRIPATQGLRPRMTGTFGPDLDSGAERKSVKRETPWFSR